MRVDIEQRLELKDLLPGSAFRQPFAAGNPGVMTTVYIVLDDGPRDKAHEIMVAILNTGKVLRWPTNAPVVPLDVKLVPA